MTTKTIEKGSEVIVSVVGEFTGEDYAGNQLVVTKDGITVTVPKGTETYVTKKPLPAEPKGGSRVAYGSAIYKRDSYAGWYRLDGKRETVSSGGRKFYSWPELNDTYGRGNLVRLVEDQTSDATDLTDKTATFGGLTAQVTRDGWGDLRLTVSVDSGYGCKATATKTEARRLAFAILKATGGM
jgi:hypothetical protein